MLGKRISGCLFFSALCLAGCGLNQEPAGSRALERRSEVVYQEEEGLEGAVRIDSLGWRPFLFGMALEGPVEVEGLFAARFTSLAQTRVQVRYDLRFFDADEFLIDAFIPFGQPVVLEPGQVQSVEGEFRIRAPEARDLERLALMRLVARVRRPD
jgi:hypothetical protein